MSNEEEGQTLEQQAETIADKSVLPYYGYWLGEMLDALIEYFPECGITKTVKMKYDMGTQLKQDFHRMLMRMWHSHMGPVYSACQTRDVETLRNLDFEIFNALKIKEKWEVFDDESKEVFWDYMLALNILTYRYAMVTDRAYWETEWVQKGNSPVSYTDPFQRN